MQERYRYTATAENGASRELAPLNTRSLKIGGKREGQNIFFRRKLQGELLLAGDDFTFIMALENSPDRCGNVRLLIERYCSGKYEVYWRGIFSMSDCKPDLDACKVTASVEPDDAYRVLLENMGKQHNVLKTPLANIAVNTRIDLTATFEFKLIPADKIGDQEAAGTWAVFLRARNWIDGVVGQNGTRESNDIIFRLTRQAPFIEFAGTFIAPDLSREGWRTVAEDTTTKIAYYAKAPNLYNFKPYEYGTKADWYGKYPDLQQKAPAEAWDAVNFIEVSGIGGANSDICNTLGKFINLRYYVNESRCKRLIWQIGAFRFSRGRRLLDALDYLVTQTNAASRAPSPAAQSEFFSSATNYVTNQANDLLDLLLFQKTDILSYASTEQATKGEISLKSLLDDLRDMFQVYWFLDAAGKFRLEHLSYFQDSGTTDLTARPDWARYVKGTRSYEYNKSEMPRYERLLFGEAFGDDFLKAEIEYTDPCVNKQEGQDTKETTISRFNNDLKGLLTGGSTSNTGFTLVAHRGGTVIKSNGALTNTPQTNAVLSAANLVSAYWRHGRVLLGATLNGAYTQFASTAKNRKQAAITVPECCQPVNPYARFITTLGSSGSLDSWIENLEPPTLSFVVLHNAPAETNSAGAGRSFNESFDESFG